jgi:hypothetical protein
MDLQPFSPFDDIRGLYDRFDAPVTDVDCGQMCAPSNPRGIPFCCDIRQAVPAAYRVEWSFLQERTDLWREYREDVCAGHGPAIAGGLPGALIDPGSLSAKSPADLGTPAHMLLLACRGPAHCQRPFRALSCRQFPFFPYLTSWGQFIGLAYEWEFEAVCWVIHNLPRVTPRFRTEFVQVYDQILAASSEDFKAYYLKSEEMRAVFAERRKRIPLLHRNGKEYRVSAASERLRRV